MSAPAPQFSGRLAPSRGGGPESPNGTAAERLPNGSPSPGGEGRGEGERFPNCIDWALGGSVSIFRIGRLKLKAKFHAPFALQWPLIVLAAAFLVTTPLHAENTPNAFEAANRLYFEGKFAEAATTYGMLAQSGQASGALYFNWGNALFKSGQIGRAIAAYRQAESLSPRDPDVRANLQFARNQRQGPTLSPRKSDQWLRKLTLNEWATLAALAIWLFFGALAFLQLRPASPRTPKGFLGILGAAALLLCGCAVAALYDSRAEPEAIVVANDAIVRNGPLDESANAFTVHDGAELAVMDRKDDWLQVEAGGGRQGWIKKDQVVLSNG